MANCGQKAFRLLPTIFHYRSAAESRYQRHRSAGRDSRDWCSRKRCGAKCSQGFKHAAPVQAELSGCRRRQESVIIMKMENPFGAITLLWSENFCAKDIWIFEKIRELGFTAVDIAVGDPEDFPVREAATALKETGLVPVITKALPHAYNPVSPDPNCRAAAVDYLKGIVDIAAAVDAQLVAGVIYAGWGYRTGAPCTEDEWKRSVECTRKVAEYAKDAGITLAPEVINRYVTHILNTAADGVRYCRDVGMENVKVHLDTFHMMIEEESISGAIRTCGKEYLGYFHTCENQRGIPGTGLVPWREVFTTLHEIDYTGPMAIESYAPNFVRIAGNSCIWRKFASSGDEFARLGLRNLTEIIHEI